MWKGRLFTPRGLGGLHRIVGDELKRFPTLATVRFDSKLMRLEKVDDLHALAKLRVPQSIWVSLIRDRTLDAQKPVESLKAMLGEIAWDQLPVIRSFGPRMTVVRENRSLHAGQKLDLLSCLQEGVGHMHAQNEFSLRIDHTNRVSLEANMIGPRAWIPPPSERVFDESQWSVQSHAEDDGGSTASPDRPSDLAIKEFRNEQSLACLCAGLVQCSGVVNVVRKNIAAGREAVIWDMLAGSGTMLLETIQALTDSDLTSGRVVLIGNCASKQEMDLIAEKVMKLVNSTGGILVADPESSELGPTDELPPVHAGGRKRRHTSRKNTAPTEEESQASPAVDSEMRTINFTVNTATIPSSEPLSIQLNLTTVPVQDTSPYIRSAIILSHIPKQYRELTGIGKHQLSEWGVLGSVLEGNKDRFSAYFFTETGSFSKYSRLKFRKLVHLVSPGGNSIGSYSQWTGF